MEIAEHISVVAGEGRLFAVSAEQAGLDADIPTCPDWNMRDLVRHLSEIHLWAAARVAKRTSKLFLEDRSELTESWPDLAVFWPEDEGLVDWYLDTNANLVNALATAPEDLDCPTFLPAPSPLAMWARRQAHETAVHRFDAQLAGGTASSFDPEFAADGIDELLAGFAPRSDSYPVDRERNLGIHATDTNDRWTMMLSPDGITTVRGDGPADVTLTGRASDLYLVMWNRKEDSSVTVEGDSEILDIWHGRTRITWTLDE